MPIILPQSLSAIWVISVSVSLIAIALCTLSRRLYWLVVPLCLFAVLKSWMILESRENMHDGIVSEFGLGYFLQYALATALPLIAVLIYGTFAYRRRPRSATL